MIQAVRKDSQTMLDIIEKKVGVLPDDLLKADLRDIGLEIIEECNRAINIAALDEKITRFEEVDTASLRKASELIEKSASRNRTLKLNNQREIKVDEELTKFNEHLTIIENNKKSFSRIEIALRLELATISDHRSASSSRSRIIMRTICISLLSRTNRRPQIFCP